LAVIVQKFGGTSVADAAKLRASAQHAVAARARGHGVVLVVSAMGHSTDTLVKLAAGVDADPSYTPDARELDQLLATGEQVACAMMALTLLRMGVRAVSLTGQQAGIMTDHAHGRAGVVKVETGRVRRLLDQGVVPVVCGFQGVTPEGDVATLGRGGSDITAVALAAALGASCEVYKDVDGVFTADPRVVPEARLRPSMTYEEMLEAASLGSQVIHPRAVELARRARVPVRVRHSQRDAGEGFEGTHLVDTPGAGGGPVVSSVVLKPRVARVSLRGVPMGPGVQSSVFSPIARAHIPVDDIMQEEDGLAGAGRVGAAGAGGMGAVNITFTLDGNDLPLLRPLLGSIERACGASGVRVDDDLCTVSVVGAGMRSAHGVAAAMFDALARAGVLVENICTSEVRISAVMNAELGHLAVRCLHECFGLHSAASEARAAQNLTEVKPSAPAPV
jgi:aspartate kinase